MNKNRVGNADKTNATILPTGDDSTTQKSSKTPSPHKLSPTPHPLVQLTKGGFASSLEESDSSSLPDTTNNTWSCSTAATAIQQANNLSSNSLHLELNSLSSLTHTPQRTPTLESIQRRQKDTTPTTITSSMQTDPYEEIKHCDSSITPDESQEIDYCPMSTAIIRELHLEADNLDRQVFGDSVKTRDSTSSEIEYEKLGKDSLDMIEDLRESEAAPCTDDCDISKICIRKPTQKISPLFNGKVDTNLNMNENESSTNFDSTTLNPFVEQSLPSSITHKAKEKSINCDTALCDIQNSSVPEVLIPLSTTVPNMEDIDEMATNAAEEVAFSKSSAVQHNRDVNNAAAAPKLPPPSEFGGGNPFLMFLCLTLLLQHRNVIMKRNMDYNEIAMHFDKMVRKHDVTRVLNQARRMYIDYLKSYASYNQDRHPKQHQASYEQQSSIAANIPNSNDVNRNATNAITSQQQNQQTENRKYQQHSNNHSSASSSTASAFYTKS